MVQVQTVWHPVTAAVTVLRLLKAVECGHVPVCPPYAAEEMVHGTDDSDLHGKNTKLLGPAIVSLTTHV
jgi:hypothetical protein